MANRLREYLEDPFLAKLYAEVRRAGALRPISVDLTHLCNIRCQGCYFFGVPAARWRGDLTRSPARASVGRSR